MARKSVGANSGLANEPTNDDHGIDPEADGNDSGTGSDDNSSFGEGGVIINPGDIINGSPDPEPDTGNQPKRRGRPKGSRNNSSSRKSEKEATNDLTSALVGLHLLASKMTKIEELEMDEDEAAKLSKSMSRVASLYTDYIVPEKVLAWGGLITTVAAVYGPRIGAYNLRKKNEAKEKAAGTHVPPGTGPIVEGVIA